MFFTSFSQKIVSADTSATYLKLLILMKGIIFTFRIFLQVFTVGCLPIYFSTAFKEVVNLGFYVKYEGTIITDTR